MATNGSFRPTARRCYEALKGFLSSDAPISKRAAMYRLLSMGLLESTKRFAKFNATLNTMLENDSMRCDRFNDDCFVDNRRRTEQLNTWANAADFREWCIGIYHRDYWQDQPQRVEVRLG